MEQKKLYRFSQFSAFPNVLEHTAQIKFNDWQLYFSNNQDIVLELACGKGEYTTGLAQLHPERNYIGVDIKGNRMYIGAKLALSLPLPNVAFLRIKIEDIESYFLPRSVSEIWILFPDPFLKEGKAKNRLTHPKFLKSYQKILKPGALIHLKTDSGPLYRFTLETILNTNSQLITSIEDVYGQDLAKDELGIQTFYEKGHLQEGRVIYYLAFKLSEQPIAYLKERQDNNLINPYQTKTYKEQNNGIKGR